MANICLYKIKVIGRKRACFALVDMMPLYSWEKEIISSEGNDDNCTLVFSGGCKWSVASYTRSIMNPKPFTDEELNSIKDGDYWDKTLSDKSILLDCEIFCNSKDIDEACFSVYEHWDRGYMIEDECPKELHIKRGRDYDHDYIVMPINVPAAPPPPKNIVKRCKVKFEGGTYWYTGDYEVNDVVEVDGQKKGEPGRVIEATFDIEMAFYPITKKLAHIGDFYPEDIEKIYMSRKPKERKEWLISRGLDEKTTKKKFVSICDTQWTKYALKNDNWQDFLEMIGFGEEN